MNSQLPDGVYIATNEKLTKVSEYRESNPDAHVAVKFGSHVVIISSKNATWRMNWIDAKLFASTMRLGDKIEWMIIDKYVKEVRDSLEKLGHDIIPYEWIWLETESSDTCAYSYNGKRGNLEAHTKLTGCYVRLITSFQLL